MSIVSVSFLVLLAIVLLLYALLPQPRRWWALLAASLAFYLISDAAGFVFLLVASLGSYCAARGMQALSDAQKAAIKAQPCTRVEKAAIRARFRRKRKACLICALALDLGLLCVFKYAHFALQQFSLLSQHLGGQGFSVSWRLIAPLGISFYTFQSVGYLVDVYSERCQAVPSYPRLLLFVSFFPQITQGPIGTYAELSQTLYAGRAPEATECIAGFQRLLWGYMKKMVVANALAQNTVLLFTYYESYAGVSVLLGACLYLVQLYADFSGYMDIMCGFCQMLGVRLTENFRRPFFSKSLSEYWRRWHISLGAWFRQYVYYPIGVSSWNLKLGKACRKHLSKHAAACLPPSIALLITWFLTGLWHGASFGYIVWGLLNGWVIILSLWLAPAYARAKALLHIDEKSFLWRAFCVLRTFLLAALLEVLPEVGTLREGFHFWACIVTHWRLPESLADWLPFVYLNNFNRTIGFLAAMGGVLLMLGVSLLQRKRPVRAVLSALPIWVQAALLAALFLLIATFGIQASWGAEGFMYARF